MNRISINTGLIGEGLSWIINSSPWEESQILKEECKLQDDIKALFFPNTAFVAPGLERKTTEEDEDDIEDEDMDCCESSDGDIDDETLI